MYNPLIDLSSPENAPIAGALDEIFDETFGHVTDPTFSKFQFIGAIMHNVREGSGAVSFYKAEAQMAKLEELVRHFQAIRSIQNELHFGAHAEFVRLASENLQRLCTVGDQPSDGFGKTHALENRFDFQLRRILRAVLGDRKHEGEAIKSVKEMIKLDPMHNKEPRRSEKRYIRAKVMKECREAWEMNLGRTAPQWLNGTDSQFERFLRSVFEIFPEYESIDLKNVSKAYKDFFSDAPV
jgi:hypothetical protein